MNPVSLYDMEAMARQVMPHDLWDYVAGGASDEITIRRNREAFDAIVTRPRFLVDVSNRDTSTTVLGERIAFPVMAAPTGSQWAAHPDAEVAVAKAAGDVGTLMAVATGASYTIEEIEAATSGPLWFQLYHLDDEVTKFHVRKAKDAGYSAICLTVGSAGGVTKERDMRNDYSPSGAEAWADLRDDPRLQEKVASVNRSPSLGLTWSRLEWLRGLTGLPLVVKEILTAEDALLCVEHGADAIVVSNHGGRSFDTVPASIDVLPEIVDAVGDKIEVYLDSGVRRGTDVLKALALGARAVLVGRPLFWGLAIDGEAGVRTMFEILRAEFDRAMAFCGCTSVGDINETHVARRRGRWGRKGRREGGDDVQAR